MKNILLFTGKYTIFGTLITILNIWSIFLFSNSFWGTTFFILYLLFFGFYFGQVILPTEKNFWKRFFGIIGTILLFIIIQSIIYWLYKIDQFTVSATLILIPLIISLQKTHEEDPFAGVENIIDPKTYEQVRSYLSTKLLGIIVLGFDLILFAVLWSRRFTDTLISPWTIFGKNFFILFFLTTFILLIITQRAKKNAGNLFLIITHFTLIFTIALIVFKLGYGFDPFIHQATEKYIATNGFITPKNPYYIGQYMYVVGGNFLTHLSIHTLDKSIVPFFAGIILVLSLYFPFSKKESDKNLLPAILMIPFIMLPSFIMTTPNNFALLLAVLLTGWMWYQQNHQTKNNSLFGWLICLAAMSIHPFIGLPMTIIYFFFIWRQQIKKNIIRITSSIIYSLSLIFVTPLAFLLNAWRSGEKLLLKNPLENLSNFFSIFAHPHWILIERGVWWQKILYSYRDCIKPLAITMILAGIYFAWKKWRKSTIHFYIITAISLFISAFIISTTIKFPDVISYEQTAYGKRLLELTLILLLPFFIAFWQNIFDWLRQHKKWRPLLSLGLAGLLLLSFYFTYPTRDNVSLHTGYNVRQADIKTVHFIDNLNNHETNYIVLTNQLVSVAALREFGFAQYLTTPVGEQYFYSIPTGGPFYQYFRKMVYEEPKKAWMIEAMNYAGVDKAYFVHTNYWAPAGIIRDQAKLEADRWWELDEGRVWVFEYTRN